MNAKVHDTIGVSPAELLFEQAINLYSGLLSAIPPESLIKGLDESASGRLSDHDAKLTKAQNTLIKVARNNQVATDSHHMREAVPFSHVFPVNSYVLYRPLDNSRDALGRLIHCRERPWRQALHSRPSDTQGRGHSCLQPVRIQI
jgi:hypothetical protein